MATKTVCDRCERSPNGLKAVTATFGCESTEDAPAVPRAWKVKFMCPGCRERVEGRIALAMAPPVKREGKKVMVDLETPPNA